MASFSSDSVVNSQEETIPRNSAGRPQKEVWDYIQKVAPKDRGHYSAKCICGKSWARGKPKNLEDHLATECTKVSIEVKQKFLRIVAARNNTKENDNERDTEEDFPIFKKALADITIKIENEIEKEKNLTIGLDGWTNPIGQSIYAYLLMTSNKKEYLYSLRNYSKQSHTGKFLADEIQDIIETIGVEKFSGIVTDGAANMKLAKNLVVKAYPYILPIRCIAHHINLITKDILKQQWASNLMKKCQSIVKWTKLSHQAGELFRELQQEYLISGGGIQSSVKTRWSTAWDCLISILRLQPFIKDVANIINSRGFFDDIECLARIICPAKEAVKAVECKSTTLADVYIKLVQLASAIHHIPPETEHREFRRICIQIYNRRWDEFDFEIFKLGYFFHPKYRGAGLQIGGFRIIAKAA
ncbi:12298_t:CDS:2, partial [Cetraspora pellucida]